MSILKKYFQKKEKDEFGEAYARTMSSLIGNLKEMDLLLKNYKYACENWKEITKDLDEVADKTIKLVKEYNNLLETIIVFKLEPQD